jgi:hypothetical protein
MANTCVVVQPCFTDPATAAIEKLIVRWTGTAQKKVRLAATDCATQNNSPLKFFEIKAEVHNHTG